MKIRTEKGDVNIAGEIFTTISGFAASNSFGVKGMVARTVQDGIVQLLRKESLAKGVKVSFPEDSGVVNIELHIEVDHGVNMPAVCGAMVGEVRYNVEKLTGVPVGTVDIYVDAIASGT